MFTAVPKCFGSGTLYTGRLRRCFLIMLVPCLIFHVWSVSPGIILQLFHVSSPVLCTEWHKVPRRRPHRLTLQITTASHLAPQRAPPALDPIFKHIHQNTLVRYLLDSQEEERARLLKKKRKIWLVGKRENWLNARWLFCVTASAHTITESPSHTVWRHKYGDTQGNSQHEFSPLSWEVKISSSQD